MTEYNARIELKHRDPTEAWMDSVLDALEGYGPAISTGVIAGTVEIVLTVPAADLRQAFTTALALVRDATSTEPLVVEVMPTAEFDRRLGIEPMPELLSVTQAAERLGTSRQAVLQRLESGSLPGTKVGNTWAIQAAAVRARQA